MLSGVVAQSRLDPAWCKIATSLRDVILTSFRAPSGLFFDSGTGFRRYFASFATQVYSCLGLFHYGEAMDDPLAIAAVPNTRRRTTSGVMRIVRTRTCDNLSSRLRKSSGSRVVRWPPTVRLSSWFCGYRSPRKSLHHFTSL
jgi:hypothetical protein